jgi:hypothetical protein
MRKCRKGKMSTTYYFFSVTLNPLTFLSQVHANELRMTDKTTHVSHVM